MIEHLFTSLHWARPHLLWLLLVLPVLGLWAWRRRGSASALSKVVDAHLLPHLLDAQPRRLRSWPLALLLGTALAICALAGPGWQQQEQPQWQTQSPLVLLMDLSTRSTATDLPPSRLLQARAKLARLLALREGGQVALVVYAHDAYTVAPLTDDTANVALYLDALSPAVMPSDGHETARGLAWATQLLQRSGAQQGRILLLTDSADAAAIEAASQAAAQGMRVSVLGMGTPAGAAFRDGLGRIETAALDEASLRRLASAGDGRYQRVANDDADLRALGVLRADEGAARQGDAAAKQWQDQGYWLLPLVMLLALLAFRRRSGLLAALLVVALSPPQASWATPAAKAPATVAPVKGGLWQRADQRQHQRLEQGVQAYREGDAAAAAGLFEGNDSADGWYNLGNARARQGDYDGALQAYDRALTRQPGMADAIANRAVVDAARKRQPPAGGKQPQGQQGQSSKPPQGQGQGQPGERGQPQPSPGQQGQQGQPQNGQTPPGKRESETPPPSAADPQAQAQADEAQRQRMQQAMQRRQGNATQGQQAVDEAALTPQQREQRQAVEAWMRRVPDEPGNLLRAKFQLENERRKREGR